MSEFWMWWLVGGCVAWWLLLLLAVLFRARRRRRRPPALRAIAVKPKLPTAGRWAANTSWACFFFGHDLGLSPEWVFKPPPRFDLVGCLCRRCQGLIRLETPPWHGAIVESVPWIAVAAFIALLASSKLR